MFAAVSGPQWIWVPSRILELERLISGTSWWELRVVATRLLVRGRGEMLVPILLIFSEVMMIMDEGSSTYHQDVC